jgi:hypothetical protein
LRASAKRPLTNSLCARSKAPSAADSSTVGCLGGGGGAGVGRTALTAASFCVFLTLGTSTFLVAAATLRAAGFVAGRLAFAATFGLAAVFRVAVTFAVLRVADLAAAARVAFGLAAADFALTARFAVFAVVRFAFERVGDRRKPFVRLLLMGGISKGCSQLVSSRWNRRQLTTAPPLNQRIQLFAGAFTSQLSTLSNKCTNKEKHLKVIVGYVKVRLAYGGSNHLGTMPQPDK